MEGAFRALQLCLLVVGVMDTSILFNNQNDVLHSALTLFHLKAKKDSYIVPAASP